MAARQPLSTLLSQVLVAFTIEFDNEFERRMRHRTTRGMAAGSRHGPWLTSLVMWLNLMQHVRDEGVTVGELQRLARIAKLPLEAMERWGYIVVAPDPSDVRPKPPRRDWVVRPTAAGRKAQEVWLPLFDVIEERWLARFGGDEIGKLRESLDARRRRGGESASPYAALSRAASLHPRV
jgi:DNA-binding MarR family transcriptional regulator